MKNEFIEYYQPSEEDFARLWAEGTIVLDTNSLLNLYRTPNNAREEFLSVLKILADRLWIPYQVGLEFQRNRLSVISAKGKIIDDAFKSGTSMFEKLRDEVVSLELDKYGLDIETQPLIEQLQLSSENLAAAIKNVHKAQVEVAAKDTIRETLDDLYNGKIGPSPVDAAEMTLLIKDGERRYNESIPPGYSDKDKDKNPNEATFIHNNIKYDRKYGDLILWRQLIEYVKASNIQALILVTADKKEDWWRKDSGKTIGPHPELIREIHRETALRNFWMYSPDQFLSYAAQYVNAQISTKAVEEIRDVSRSTFMNRSTSSSRGTLFEPYDEAASKLTPELDIAEYARGNRSVKEWLDTKFRDVEIRLFPDYEAVIDGAKIGFATVYVPTISNNPVEKMLAAANMTIDLSTIPSSHLYLIVMTDAETYRRDMEGFDRRTRRNIVMRQLSQVLEHYELGGIYFGLLAGDRFRSLYFRDGGSGDLAGA